MEGSDFDQCWDMLKTALCDIHNKNCSGLSFEELYRAAYKIVLKKKGSVLYDHVKEFEQNWFADNVIPKIERLVTRNLVGIEFGKSSGGSINQTRQAGESFLKGIRDAWDDHNTSMNMIADILMYLDRGYTQADASRSPIFSATIALFRDNILKSALSSNTERTVGHLLVAVILHQIDMEREGDVIDRALLRSCTRMFNCLYMAEVEAEGQRLYLTWFEPQLLKASEDFYTEECRSLLREADAGAWLRRSQQRLDEEADRCKTTVELESLPKMQMVIEEALIKEHLGEFLNLEGSGVKWMLDNDKVEDLSILYRLISRIDDQKLALRDILKKRVVELGIEIEKTLEATDFSMAPDGDEGGDGERKALNPAAQQTAAAIKWVDDVLQLKDKFDRLLRLAFREDQLIQTSLAMSFAEFINLFNRSSEYVSLFIDDNLKRGIKGKTEAEVDLVLDKAVVLIRYLQDKDMFQSYYQRHLARRLLFNKSESHDVEKEIIGRMRSENGQQFTSKFEGMFRDLATSMDLSAGYRERMQASASGDKLIDLNISLLTTNYWPPEVMGRTTQIGDEARITCNYPRELQKLQASFEQFYLGTRSGRKLTWVGTTGSADIKCVFPAIPGKSGPLAKERRYEINVPTFAMVAMMLFNDLEEGESLTFEEIQERTQISTQDLMRSLAAIAVAPKSRVLLKEPLTKSIKPTDRFSFNPAFVSKTIRIKAPIVNASSKVEDAQERKNTVNKTTQDRSHTVDAAIVRIMKYVFFFISSTNSFPDVFFRPFIGKRPANFRKLQVPKGTRSRKSGRRGAPPAPGQLPARGIAHQEAHRGSHWARVSGASRRFVDV